jgi:hypothetical protein
MRSLLLRLEDFRLLPVFVAVSMAVGMTATDAPKMEGSEIMSLIIVGIALLQLVYAYWQSKRGVLR